MLNSGGVSSDSQGRIGDPFVTVHGMYLEKADQESGLMTQIGSIGVYIHASSGEVNLRGRDPLDEIKVVARRSGLGAHCTVTSMGLTQDGAHQDRQSCVVLRIEETFSGVLQTLQV